MKSNEPVLLILNDNKKRAPHLKKKEIYVFVLFVFKHLEYYHGLCVRMVVRFEVTCWFAVEPSLV